MNSNNKGIVLCLLIYLTLCAFIVSLIELPWVVVPVGSKVNVNVSLSTESLTNVTIQAQTNNTYNATWTASIAGSCGMGGYCWPFEDDSVMTTILTGQWGSRCYHRNPIDMIKGSSKEPSFDLSTHLPLYMSLGGVVVMLLTWLLSIAACCNQDCGYCTLYSVFAVMLTFGGSVIGAANVLFFLFGNSESSCIQLLCGDIETAFDIGHCQVGWSLMLSCAGIACVFILAIVSCVLAGQTDTRKNIHNPIVDVRPAAYPGQAHKGQGFMQSRA